MKGSHITNYRMLSRAVAQPGVATPSRQKKKEKEKVKKKKKKEKKNR